jgi:hypothetical protein
MLRPLTCLQENTIVFGVDSESERDIGNYYHLFHFKRKKSAFRAQITFVLTKSRSSRGGAEKTRLQK